MSFISYAQNYEDVMLARAFAGLETGFYVDVGAQDPRFDSVTKAFYDRGWRGINLEPVEFWHRRLVEQRPRDINLCLAAGAYEGTVDLFEVRDSGLSTTSTEFARRHHENGLTVDPPRRVPVRRLDTICVEHGVSQVQFLKVDAEGAEAHVLRGMQLSAIRPWVVLVEATEPNSRTSNHGDWESLLTGRGYVFVYDDGLNRFYLAEEHGALSSAFAVPPNVFDGFVRREQVDEAERLLQILRESDVLLKDRALHIGELADRIGGRDVEIARLVEAHRIDATTMQAQAAQAGERDVEIARLAAAHRHGITTIQALAAQVGERDVEITRLVEAHGHDVVEAAGLRERLADLDRRTEQLEHIGARLSRELMATQASQLASQASELASQAALVVAEAHAARVHLALEDERRELARLIASRSWRLTAPLRATATRARNSVWRLESAAHALARRRFVRGLTAVLLSPFPNLARAVKRRLYGEPVEAAAFATANTPPLPLTEDAEDILARLPIPATHDADHH